VLYLRAAVLSLAPLKKRDLLKQTDQVGVEHSKNVHASFLTWVVCLFGVVASQLKGSCAAGF